MDKQTERERETVSTAQRARDLFARWAAEEEAGYEGGVSWEELKRSLDFERYPPERELFPEHDSTLPRVQEGLYDNTEVRHPLV